MINRTLIRIKVVQMLYSYLLTRSDFEIEAAPASPTPDAKYAHGLYMDLLLLVLELCGNRVQQSEPRCVAGFRQNKLLADSKLVKTLGADDSIKTLIMRDGSSVADFNPILQDIYNAVISSASYTVYAKKPEYTLGDDVRFWGSMLSGVIAKMPEVQALCRKQEGFTLYGYEHAFSMAVKTLTNFSDTDFALFNARQNLSNSLLKARELYLGLMMLVCDITAYRDRKIDFNKHKLQPSEEDLFPNTRFIDNKFAAKLADNEELQNFAVQNAGMWLTDATFLPRVTDRIMESDIYTAYMEGAEPDWNADCELWRSLFKNVILPGDALAEDMEAKSVFWNDDLDIMGTFVLKTIRQAAVNKDEEIVLLPDYKDEEDREFGSKLFNAAVAHRAEYMQLIEQFVDTRRWEAERIAFMDSVVMLAAIAEMMAFPEIQLQVTLNEYIEIAKNYSSERSGRFINGVLGAVIQELRSTGQLLKPIK